MEIEINIEEDPTVVRQVPGHVQRTKTPLPEDPVRQERDAVISAFKATLAEDFAMPPAMVEMIEWAASVRIYKGRVRR